METMTLKVEGVSEEQIQQDIFENTRGFRLFFHTPKKADYTFLNPFWGYKWEFYDDKQLRDIILNATMVENKIKPFVLAFLLDGKERFAFCSWTCQLYDFNTNEYYQFEGDKLAQKISNKILEIMAENILNAFGYYRPEEEDE